MELITRDELKAKMARGDQFKLVMTLSEWGFRAKHIPGSLSVTNPAQATEMLDPADEIVIYCSDEHCAASKYAYHLLTTGGFQNVRRYAGGIEDWEAHGLPVEGEWAIQAKSQA